MRGVALLVLVIVLATMFGLWRRVTDGRMREVSADDTRRPVPDADDAPAVDLVDEVVDGWDVPPDIDGDDIGTALGSRATLVQFSSAFCQPCVATRRILSEVSGMVEGVVHVDIDSESHLDLVRRLNIRRTPTVLVVDPNGRITRRASGAPRKADVIAAIGAVDGGSGVEGS